MDDNAFRLNGVRRVDGGLLRRRFGQRAGPALLWRVVLAALFAPGVADGQATATAPAAAGLLGGRPIIAIIGFESDPEGDPRDAWTATALEELLTWRLRRVPAVVAVPTVRVHQSRLELRGPEASALRWNDVVRGLGARFHLSGRCRGAATAVEVTLVLQSFGAEAGEPARTRLPPGRFDAVLDVATRWVLEHLGVGELEPAVAERVLVSPSRSSSAVEYHARATMAVWKGELRDAVRYARDAVYYDKEYRPALQLLTQLEMQSDPGRTRLAVNRLRALSELARRDDDLVDRASAELSLSVLARSSGSWEAALTRANNALRMARDQRDVYAEIATLGWLTDLHTTWRPPPGSDADEAARRAAVEEKLEEAVRFQRLLLARLDEIGDRIGALPAASKLALLHERLEQPEAALAMHRRTLAIAQSLGSRTHEATAWLYLGRWHREQERYEEAIEAMSRCVELAEASARPAVWIALGGVYQAMDRPAEALAQFEQAYEQLRDTTDMMTQFTCLREMARVRKQLGQRLEALKVMQEAVDVAQALELPEEKALRDEMAVWRNEAP
jgi:tetratricopeptide (TPR) repeat protein/TolB-like protein